MMDRSLRMPGDHCMWCVEPSDEPCPLDCRKPTYPTSQDDQAEPASIPTPISAVDGQPLFDFCTPHERALWDSRQEYIELAERRAMENVELRAEIARKQRGLDEMRAELDRLRSQQDGMVALAEVRDWIHRTFAYRAPHVIREFDSRFGADRAESEDR
jgi:hypothetical protein